MKITPICNQKYDGGITVTLTLDTRHPAERLPIVVRVTYRRTAWYYQTGQAVPLETYPQILNARGTKSEAAQARMYLEGVFRKVCKEVEKIKDTFSLAALKSALGKTNPEPGTSTFLSYWTRFADAKPGVKTRDQHRQAASSFFQFLGAKMERTRNQDGTLNRRMELRGPQTRLAPRDLTQSKIDGWTEWMAAKGQTVAGQAVYLRAMRGVINALAADGLLTAPIKVRVQEGGRRQDDFLTVPEIKNLTSLLSIHRAAVDWWLILYFSNGCNLKDLAMLRYTDSFFYDNELTFVRAKTAHKSPVKVFIPVIEPLHELMQKYASTPEKGALVYPQITLGASTPEQIAERVHGFNAFIRGGMLQACKELGIKPASPSTARNSYITCLTWHGVSDAFIDAMVGHVSGKNVLRGYQGGPSPKKRAAINDLLLIDPEQD